MKISKNIIFNSFLFILALFLAKKTISSEISFLAMILFFFILLGFLTICYSDIKLQLSSSRAIQKKIILFLILVLTIITLKQTLAILFHFKVNYLSDELSFILIYIIYLTLLKPKVETLMILAILSISLIPISILSKIELTPEAFATISFLIIITVVINITRSLYARKGIV